jgi:hypothetical protein
MVWEQVNFQWDDDDEVCFVLDQHAELDLYSASSLKQQSTGRHVNPIKTHYPDSAPTCKISDQPGDLIWYNFGKEVECM